MDNRSRSIVLQALDATSWNLLPLQADSATTSRSPANNVPERLQRPVCHEGRVRGGGVGEQAGASLGAGLGVPVVGLFGAADDCAAVEVSGYAEAPGAVCVLACVGDGGGVGDEACLA